MDVWEKVARSLQLAWKGLSFLSLAARQCCFLIFFSFFPVGKKRKMLLPLRKNNHFSVQHGSNITFGTTWVKDSRFLETTCSCRDSSQTATTTTTSRSYSMNDAPGGPWGPWRRHQGLTRCILEYLNSTCNKSIKTSNKTNRRSTANTNCLITVEETSKFLWELNLLGRRRRRACQDMPPTLFHWDFLINLAMKEEKPLKQID